MRVNKATFNTMGLNITRMAVRTELSGISALAALTFTLCSSLLDNLRKSVPGDDGMKLEHMYSEDKQNRLT
jgi:hypothetical protein